MQNRHLYLAFLACVGAFALLTMTISGLHASSASSSTILISAVYYDTYLAGEPGRTARRQAGEPKPA